MKNSDTFENGLIILGAIAAILFAVAILPFITFWCAYFGGWIASITIGDVLCNALNTLFHTSRFTKEMLPWCAAALGWIGGYFKSTHVNSNKK